MNPIEVAAALIFRQGKLLITQRHPQAHLGGLWEFPGGKRETGETFEHCLARELEEELGVEVDILGEIESVTHEYPEKIVHLKFFRCVLNKNEPKRLGCPDFRWITREQLAHYAFPAADARLVSRLQQSAELWR